MDYVKHGDGNEDPMQLVQIPLIVNNSNLPIHIGTDLEEDQGTSASACGCLCVRSTAEQGTSEENNTGDLIWMHWFLREP